MSNLIENRTLRVKDVPHIDPTTLRDDGWDGSAGDAANDWSRLWAFASTFDGYRYFGADPDATDRLAAFTHSVRKSYDQRTKLPDLDLALLRACLFYEQREWCKASMEPPGARDKQYFSQLLDAIRLQIS